MFGRIYLMIVWFYQHKVAIICWEIFFDLFGTSIVHHIKFDFVAFVFQKLELGFVCGKDCVVV
jgi:hypothetical protein